MSNENEFKQMTIREMCKIMDAGKKLELKHGGFCYKDFEDKFGPYILQTKFTKCRLGDSWQEECRILEEKPWRPEHEEKVLCMDDETETWKSMFYSHTTSPWHYSIGGHFFKILAPFDITKLGTVDPVEVQWKVGE